jgi:hypothetical protein
VEGDVGVGMDRVSPRCPVPCGVEFGTIGTHLLEVSAREVESENEGFPYREALSSSTVWIPHIGVHYADDKHR